MQKSLFYLLSKSLEIIVLLVLSVNLFLWRVAPVYSIASVSIAAFVLFLGDNNSVRKALKASFDTVRPFFLDIFLFLLIISWLLFLKAPFLALFAVCIALLFFLLSINHGQVKRYILSGIEDVVREPGYFVLVLIADTLLSLWTSSPTLIVVVTFFLLFLCYQWNVRFLVYISLFWTFCLSLFLLVGDQGIARDAAQFAYLFLVLAIIIEMIQSGYRVNLLNTKNRTYGSEHH